MCYKKKETAMMMQSPNGESELLGNTGSLGHAHPQTDVKMNSMSKERKNYLQIYARQFGLNDRGCYVAVGFAALAFLLFVIVIAMGATWPGKTCPCYLARIAQRTASPSPLGTMSLTLLLPPPVSRRS